MGCRKVVQCGMTKRGQTALVSVFEFHAQLGSLLSATHKQLDLATHKVKYIELFQRFIF
jgi:hypothetical protein